MGQLLICMRGALRTASDYGFRVGSGAVFTVVPEQRVAIIILANRNGGIFSRTEGAILKTAPVRTFRTMG